MFQFGLRKFSLVWVEISINTPVVVLTFDWSEVTTVKWYHCQLIWLNQYKAAKVLVTCLSNGQLCNTERVNFILKQPSTPYPPHPLGPNYPLYPIPTHLWPPTTPWQSFVYIFGQFHSIDNKISNLVMVASLKYWNSLMNLCFNQNHSSQINHNFSHNLLPLSFDVFITKFITNFMKNQKLYLGFTWKSISIHDSLKGRYFN